MKEKRQYDKMMLTIHDTREEMGLAAARDVGARLRQLLREKEQVNCIFAAAPSQIDFLNALCEEEVDWRRVNVFHMDDYLGFEQGDHRSFGGFLSRAIFDKLSFASVNLLNGMAQPEEECARYARLLREYPADFSFIGIGENGHIAFNDPPADFNDPQLVKVVRLDMACRQQQVNDKCFDNLAEVPTHALTLTIPVLLKARQVYCMVPGERKAQATTQALNGPLSEDCPASILKTCENCHMYIDKDAAALL